MNITKYLFGKKKYTQTEIDELRKKDVEKYDKYAYKKSYMKEMVAQFEIEQNYTKIDGCDIHKDFDIENLDLEEFEKEILDDFVNPEVMKKVSCLFSKIITYSDKKDLNFSDYFSNIKLIGESSFGIVLTQDFKNRVKVAHRFCVIKIPINEYSILDIYHEYYIGKKFINKIRERGNIHFVYTYGKIFCNKPYITGGVCYGFCTSNSNPVPHLISELINPGTSIHDFIKTCSIEDYMICFMQVLLATDDANGLCDYWHGDLHTSNVIIRKTNETGYFTSYRDGKIILKCNGIIATIIDIATVSAKELDGKIFTQMPDSLDNPSISHLFSNGKIRGINYPLHDIYKYLMYSFENARDHGRNDLCNEIYRLIKYFRKEKQENLLDHPDKYYSLPIIDEYLGNKPLKKYIKYAILKLQKYNIFNNNPKDTDKIFKCTTCTSHPEDGDKDISETKLETPTTFTELLHYYNSTKNEKLLEEFNLSNAFEELLHIEVPKHFDLIEIPLNLPPNYLFLNYGVIWNENKTIGEFIDKYNVYKKRVEELFDVIDLYNAKLNINILDNYEKRNDVLNMIEQYRGINKFINEIYNHVKINSNVFNDNAVNNIFPEFLPYPITTNDYNVYLDFYRVFYSEILNLF